jgi:hypothetical protein
MAGEVAQHICDLGLFGEAMRGLSNEHYYRAAQACDETHFNWLGPVRRETENTINRI